MHKIAFIIGDRFIYWSPIILAIAVVAAACMFLALQLGRTGKATGAFVAVPLSLLLSLVFGRLVYWLCELGRYNSLQQALTDFSVNGIALTGVGIGCLVAACFVRLVGLSKSLLTMLDTMSLAGLFGMSVGQLNHFFNDGGRSAAVAASEQPIFLYQAMAYAALFLLLLLFFLICGRKKAGDTSLLGGMLYGAVQIVLDPMRQDALRFAFFDKITLAQMVGLGLMALAAAVYCVKLVRKGGWKWWYLAIWIPAVSCLTICGIQISTLAGEKMVSTLVLALLGMTILLILTIYVLSLAMKQKTPFWMNGMDDESGISDDRIK